MIFHSPVSWSSAVGLKGGQTFAQLPVQADLSGSLSLAKMYRVMPWASVSVPAFSWTLAGIVCAAGNAAVANNTKADAITVMRCMFSLLPGTRSASRAKGDVKPGQQVGNALCGQECAT